jgi:hypothetical protein
LYSTTPNPARPTFVPKAETQAVVDALPSRVPAGEYSGEAEIEATSIMMDRDGAPALGIVSLLTADGRRALANSTDAELLGAMTTEAWEGRTVRVVGGTPTNRVEA